MPASFSALRPTPCVVYCASCFFACPLAVVPRVPRPPRRSHAPSRVSPVSRYSGPVWSYQPLSLCLFLSPMSTTLDLRPYPVIDKVPFDLRQPMPPSPLLLCHH